MAIPYTRPLLHVYLQDGRENVFLLAEKEVASMLADNLLYRFKVTEEYKDVVGDLLFDAK